MMNRTSALVQSNSVQSQFAALTRDRDGLRNAMEASDRDRRIVEKQLQDLHGAHRTLTEQVRVAQGNLGTVNGQRSLWQEERARLNRQMEQERQALENAAKEVEDCEKEEKQRRRTYCQEVKNLSGNLEHLNRQYECARLKTFVSTEMVDNLYALWKQKRDNTDDSKEIESKLAEAASLLKEATEKWSHERSLNEHLQEQVKSLRDQVLASGRFEANEQELLALEESWKEERWGNSESNAYGGEDEGQHGYDNGNANGNNNHNSVHMDLFYGTDSEAGSMTKATVSDRHADRERYRDMDAEEGADFMGRGEYFAGHEYDKNDGGYYHGNSAMNYEEQPGP